MTFNRQFFAASIETHMTQRELTLRQAAKESWVSASTLSRLITGEKTPDMETFERICAWLHLEPATFFPGGLERVVDLEIAPLPLVCAILRTDEQLPDEAREKLVDLVKVAYQCLARESDA